MKYMSRIAIVTDAWRPQINGVVTTLTQTVKNLEGQGHRVKLITPELFSSIPCPTYSEIRLSIASSKKLQKMLSEFSPDCIHIATEGPLGWAARKCCLKKGFPFTTSYHSRFPEYIRLRMPVPLTLSYAVVRNFHKPAARTMVATDKLHEELEERRFTKLVRWSRGVDTSLYKPGPKKFLNLPRPISMFVGRVAVEKNIESFLDLDIAGTKVVIGDGPARTELENRYPETFFAGYKTGPDLARHMACADVLVFPSLTDTYGVVMLEAMACGVPVAAYPVTGPINVVKNGVNGWLDDDLHVAVEQALKVPSHSCRSSVMELSWSRCSSQFFDYLALRPTPLI